MSQIDWYNAEEIRKFRSKHETQMRNILQKKIEARDKGDREALTKATRALVKHMSKTKEFEKKAEEAGNCWY